MTPRRIGAGRAAAVGAALLLTACMRPAVQSVGPPPPPARYVAMGSSFAAGPGVTVPADRPETRCARSADNYARRLAARRGLALVDVSCGAARTAHLLGPWDTLPPQLDALTADTRLVTVTAGGNDVDYIGGMLAASCRHVAALPGGDGSARCAPPRALPTEADWQALEAAMLRVAAETRRRAPAARLVFVDYATVLPEGRLCAAVPLPPEQAQASRAIARRLAALTERVARASGAGLLRASALSARHHACAREPWTNGYPRPGGPGVAAAYHPNLAGMSAIAAALDRMLPR